VKNSFDVSQLIIVFYQLCTLRGDVFICGQSDVKLRMDKYFY